MQVMHADPRRLGVHAAIEVPDETAGELPLYVDRDTDLEPCGVRALIRQAAKEYRNHHRRLALAKQSSTRGGFVLLIGGSSVGKTRTAIEALRAVIPNWWLLRPNDAHHVRRVAENPPRHLVVWLDELQNFLGRPDGLTAATARALMDNGAVLVGTLWSVRYQAYTALPSSGQPDVCGNDRELLRLAEKVHLDKDFTRSEQERAHEVAEAGDQRVATALKSKDYGLTQVMAAGPNLVAAWRNADPYAGAVLNAAIDATRLGVQSPLNAELLRAAAPGYCDPSHRATAPSNWFEAALAYATARHNGAAALTPLAPPDTMGQISGYRVAEYLQQHAGHERRDATVPDTCWQALTDHLTDPHDQTRVGAAADERLLFPYAESLYRKAARDNSSYAARQLVELLAGRGREEEAIEFLHHHVDDGDPYAARRLVELLADQGREEDLRALAEAGNSY
ncbi:hypothetical protein D5H75_39680, partial [Bailinhaonella thermotolerans]